MYTKAVVVSMLVKTLLMFWIIIVALITNSAKLN